MTSHFRHLRLPFNLLLSPIYLWGVLLAGGSLWHADFWVGFVSLHLFLYGGGTAFNSWYDQDEGPIGGMAEPPPTEAGLLAFSLGWQALGLVLALWIGASFTLMWLVIALLMVLYSHPAVRLKARPVPALLAVALGQGGIGFAVGWLIVRPALESLLQPSALLGMATTALIVTGLYIVTQSYQTAEDAARGDRTLPVLLGPRRALHVALALLGVGGAVMLLVIAQRFGAGWAVVLAGLLALSGGALLRWAAHIESSSVLQNYRTAMRIVFFSSTGLSAFLLYHLL